MGKGSSPRNCFSRDFRDNFDAIDWSITKQEPEDTPSIIEGMIRQSTDNPIKQDCNCDCEDNSCANE